MNGWFFVYLLMGVLNGALLASHGYWLSDWQWWVWCAIPIITYIAGREVERSKE